MKKLLSLLIVFCCCSTAVAIDHKPAEVSSVAPSIFASENRGAVLQLIETLLHIPYVATVDCQNPTAIKVSALMSAFGTSSRLMYHLLANHQDTNALKVLLGTTPKVLAYLLASYYDLIRFLQADQLIEENKIEGDKLRTFKINQAALLSVEIVLRSLVVLAQSQGVESSSWVPWGIAELADYIGLWRLISRYTTIIMTLERLELELTIQQKPKGQNPGTDATTKGIDISSTFEQELAAFTQALPKEDSVINDENHQ